jgi:hypothetical protein
MPLDNETPELRYVSGLEVRQAGPDRPRLVGYAAVFGKRSQNLGGFVEVIRRGAFARSLRENPDVRAFVEHNPAHIIGRRTAGTLQIEEDAQGLRVEISPANTQSGRDVVENIRAGNLDGMSFAFRVPDPKKGQIVDFDESPYLRELLDVDLLEVSVVAMPAYLDTAVALRSISQFRELTPYRPSLAMRRRQLEIDQA